MTLRGTADERGSQWRRWDPHIHAPGTGLNNQFSADALDEYLTRIEAATPALECVGITDYLSTDCYEAVVVAKAAGRLFRTALVFPNIEMRLSISTRKVKGINIHLLVSPDDPSHVPEINRFLGRLTFDTQDDKYHCNRADLIRLGRAHDNTLSNDDAAYSGGVNQFKVDFNQLRDEMRDSKWTRANCLVAVAGGTNDGTSGLQEDGSGFALLRREIESFADIIFSSSPK